MRVIVENEVVAYVFMVYVLVKRSLHQRSICSSKIDHWQQVFVKLCIINVRSVYRVFCISCWIVQHIGLRRTVGYSKKIDSQGWIDKNT